MAEVDSLAQLKDIHMPPVVGWWPLAFGWYVVMAVICCLLFFCLYRTYQCYLNGRAKKQALKLLEVYASQYEKERNSQLTSARISELLKRVALVYYPRHQVASTHGSDWIAFLNKTSKQLDFEPVHHMLLDLPFKPNERANLTPLLILAKHWIKQRTVPCSN
jgi:hypothetical protein